MTFVVWVDISILHLMTQELGVAQSIGLSHLFWLVSFKPFTELIGQQKALNFCSQDNGFLRNLN